MKNNLKTLSLLFLLIAGMVFAQNWQTIYQDGTTIIELKADPIGTGAFKGGTKYYFRTNTSAPITFAYRAGLAKTSNGKTYVRSSGFAMAIGVGNLNSGGVGNVYSTNSDVNYFENACFDRLIINGKKIIENCRYVNDQQSSSPISNQNQSPNPNQVNTNDFQSLINDLNSNCQKLGMVMNLNTGSPVYNKYCKEGKSYQPTTSNKNYLVQAISEIKAETGRFDKDFAKYNQQQTQQNAYAAQQQAQRQQQEENQRRAEEENRKVTNYNNAAERAAKAANSGNRDEAIAAYKEAIDNATTPAAKKEAQERYDNLVKSRNLVQTTKAVQTAVMPLLQAWDKARDEKIAKNKAILEQQKKDFINSLIENQKVGEYTYNRSLIPIDEDEDIIKLTAFALIYITKAGITDYSVEKFYSSFDKGMKMLAFKFTNKLGIYVHINTTKNDDNSKVMDVSRKYFSSHSLLIDGAPDDIKKISSLLVNDGFFNSKEIRKVDYVCHQNLLSISLPITNDFRNDNEYFKLINIVNDDQFAFAKNFINNSFEKERAKLVNDGSVDSNYYNGLNFLTGVTVLKDTEKAIPYLIKCSDQGKEECSLILGRRFQSKAESSTGTDKIDYYNKSFLYFKKAADAGEGWAMFPLIDYYLYGRGTEMNLDKANEYLDKAKPALKIKCKEDCLCYEYDEIKNIRNYKMTDKGPKAVK